MDKQFGYIADIWTGPSLDALQLPDYKETCVYNGKYTFKMPKYLGDVSDTLPENWTAGSKHYESESSTGHNMAVADCQWVALYDNDNVGFGYKADGTKRQETPLTNSVDVWEDLSINLLNSDASVAYIENQNLMNNLFGFPVHHLKTKFSNRYVRLDFKGGAFVLFDWQDTQNKVVQFFYNNQLYANLQKCFGMFADALGTQNKYYSYMPAYSGFSENGEVIDGSKIHMFAASNWISVAYNKWVYYGDIFKRNEDDMLELLNWWKTLKPDILQSDYMNFDVSIPTFSGYANMQATPYVAHTLEVINNTEPSQPFQPFLTTESSEFSNLLNLTGTDEQFAKYFEIVKSICNTEDGRYACLTFDGDKFPDEVTQAMNVLKIDLTGIDHNTQVISYDFGDYGTISLGLNAETPTRIKVQQKDGNVLYEPGSLGIANVGHFLAPFIPIWADTTQEDMSMRSSSVLTLRHNVVNNKKMISEYCRPYLLNFYAYNTVDQEGVPTFTVTVSNDLQKGFNENQTYRLKPLYLWLWLAKTNYKSYYEDFVPIEATPDPEPPTPTDPDNPYQPGGDSGTGGGGGNFDNETDIIDLPTIPDTSIINNGMVSVYRMLPLSLGLLSDFMWSTDFVDRIAKLNQSPNDVIISLHSMPVDFGAGDTTLIKLGNIETEISSNLVPSQYVDFDCGSIEVLEYWGSFMDYSPHTKMQLYLPFIGNVTIDPDVVMNTVMRIIYRFDVLTGDCVAFIICNDTVTYQFNGNAMRQMPTSSNRYDGIIGALLGQTGAVAAGVGMIGVAAVGALGGVGLAAAGGTALSGVGTIMQSKPTVAISSTMSGQSSIMALRTPYLQIMRPRQAVPSNINTLKGLPYYASHKLADLSGYTVCDSVRLDNINNATDEELKEIEARLTQGVIL